MKKTASTLALAMLTFAAIAQNQINLLFTALENTAYVPLDSLKVTNRTQNCDTVLHWPDTMLSIQMVGIPESEIYANRLLVFQNHPNPVVDQSAVAVNVPGKKTVRIIITSLTGSNIADRSFELEKGMHEFRISAGNGQTYLFTAIAGNEKSSIKILSNNTSRENKISLTYAGLLTEYSDLKQEKFRSRFEFASGDNLSILGYYDTLTSGILDNPEGSRNYVFQFAYNTPCPGIPEFEHGGRVYQTVQIFNQCWMRENLDIGEMISGDDEMLNNGIIEKYCYDDFFINCDYFGALYQWDEMMDYAMIEGGQGICPDGWHIPTDEEWKILEGSVDSQYKVGDNEWDEYEFRGLDVAYHLKYTSYWNNNANGTNISGFSVFPTGKRAPAGYFSGEGTSARFWTSTLYSGLFGINPRDRYFYFTTSKIGRRNSMNEKEYGFAVRCVKDSDN